MSGNKKLNIKDALDILSKTKTGTRESLINQIGIDMFNKLVMLGYIEQGITQESERINRVWKSTDKSTSYTNTNISEIEDLLAKLEESEAITEKLKHRLDDLNVQLTSKINTEDEKEQLRKERDDLRNELDLEIERKKRETTENIKNAFESLDSATGDLNNEVNRLKYMYIGYIIAMFTCVILMIVVWLRYFICANSEDTIIVFWYYLSPNIILLTATLICLFQAQKCQRQLVLLKKFLYKPKQIHGLLNAYVFLSKEENHEVKIKANEVFDKYINHIICHDINIDNEEKGMNKEDNKESSIQEVIARAVGDLSSYFKIS